MVAVAMATKVRVFHFLSILVVSMATAAILKKNQPLRAQLHMAYDIPARFHKV
jgi:hypothetical protein